MQLYLGLLFLPLYVTREYCPLRQLITFSAQY